MRSLATAFATLVAATSLISCGDATPTGPSAVDSAGSRPSAAISPLVASIAVVPNFTTLNATRPTIQLVARSYDITGTSISDATVRWVSADTNIVRVSSTGFAAGRNSGQTRVFAYSTSATIDGRTISGYTTITVNGPLNTTSPTPAPVASVTLSPATATLAIGATTQLVATTRDANGNVLTGRTITWTTSSAGVATVSASGLVTAVAAGSATITATSEGRSATAAITVSAPTTVAVASVGVTLGSASLTVGQGTQATATLRDASGNVLTGRTVTWTTSNPAVATVSSAGYVTSVAAGSASIIATSEGRSGSATLTVNNPAPAPVATVTVSPASASVTIGSTVQLSATTRDAGGVILTGRTITWTSSNAAVASVSANGLVTALVAGSATITATSEGRTGTSAITVTAPAPAPVASVTVSPASLALQTGQTAQLSATTRDAYGNVLTGRTISWTSSNAGVATVSASGVVSAIAAGSATITATSEGRSGSSSVSVTATTTTTTTSSSCGAPNIWGSLGFESGISPLSSFEGWYIPYPGQGKIVADPTARSGYSFQNDYVYNPSTDQGTGIWPVFASRPQGRVYARMRYKQDPTFDNSGIKKLIRFQGPNGLVGGIASLWGRFSLGLDALSDGVNRYANVGTEITPDQLKGGWHTLELMGDWTTPNVVKYKFWIDGQLQMDYTLNRPQTGVTAYLVQFGGTWNAPGGTSRDWMDDLSVSTNCIGVN